MIRSAKTHLNTVLLVFILAIFFGRVEMCFARDVKVAGSDIEDLGRRLNFINIGDIKHGDLFSDGSQKFLCVETNDKKWHLWNPVVGSLSAPTLGGCVIPKKLHPLNSFIELISAGTRINVSNNNRDVISKMYQIYDPGLEARFCSSIFIDYYTIADSSGQSESFYIFGKLKHPFSFVKPPVCDYEMGKTETVLLSYNSISPLSYIDLGNRRVLLYSAIRSSGFSEKVILLMIQKLPDKSWASQNKIFIIPQNLLIGSFQRAGYSPKARYDALLDIIQKN